MTQKRKVVVVLGTAVVAIAACCFWPSREPVYEGKRLSQWLDEGMNLTPHPEAADATNQAFAPIVAAIQVIGTNAIPFLLRDMERKEEPRWLDSVKRRAYRLGWIDQTHIWSWRLNRSVWGFWALGTNGAPVLERLLAVYDGETTAVGSASAALAALGPFAVPELEKRLHSTNSTDRVGAASTLTRIGPAAEPAIPALLALLEDTNSSVRHHSVAALAGIGRQPERLVPLFRGLLGDSSDTIRILAANGLGRFGPSAKTAIPDLLLATNDANQVFSDVVRQALEKTAPTALNVLEKE